MEVLRTAVVVAIALLFTLATCQGQQTTTTAPSVSSADSTKAAVKTATDVAAIPAEVKPAGTKDAAAVDAKPVATAKEATAKPATEEPQAADTESEEAASGTNKKASGEKPATATANEKEADEQETSTTTTPAAKAAAAPATTVAAKSAAEDDAEPAGAAKPAVKEAVAPATTVDGAAPATTTKPAATEEAAPAATEKTALKVEAVPAEAAKAAAKEAAPATKPAPKDDEAPVATAKPAATESAATATPATPAAKDQTSPSETAKPAAKATATPATAAAPAAKETAETAKPAAKEAVAPAETAKPAAEAAPAATTTTSGKEGSDAKASSSEKKKASELEEVKPGPAGKPDKKGKKDRNVVKSKIIEFAPEANVTDVDDMSDDGACSLEIKKYCEDVEEGEGKLGDCLSDAITESEFPEDGKDVPVISDACREEVYKFKIERDSNINKNIPLAKACKVDAEKLCNVTWFFGYKSGQVIACLRDYRLQVNKNCRKQLLKVMMDAAADYRADPLLFESCKGDSERLCSGVKNGGGRIQACLRDKRMQLSWACEEQLFRQEMENSDNIRLSVRLFSRCLNDKKKFCKDVEPGSARTKDCLEEHRLELASGCKEEIDDMIERRVRDFRLDSRLRTACESEIFNMCAYFGDLDEIDTYDSTVINCLQDYASEIKTTECKKEVQKYVELASQDIRFDVPLADACFEDRQKLCANVPAGSARVIRCLSNQRDSLSPICRATLFDEEVRFSENIDFQFPLKAACTREISTFCKDIPHGNARVLRCLQEKKRSKGFGEACRIEVIKYENTISKDYRLNFRLAKSCKQDIDAICSGICTDMDGSVCGGKVYRCLTDKADSIKNEACKKEVAYFEKMEVNNFENDIILAEACRSDVEKFCSSVEPGEGRVHKCLRDNRKKLSSSCRKEELLLEETESESIELSVSLMKACSAERQLFCGDVAPGQARVFRCLAENMNDADFNQNCKFQIVAKLQRRQANWKLDPPLRKACRSDVQQYCTAEDAQNSEEGLVYKCLLNKYEELTSSCQRELGRAVHMAFYIWQTGATLTSPCDDDIQRICLSSRPNMAQRPGAVAACLAGIVEKMAQSMVRRLLPEAAGKAGVAAAGGKATVAAAADSAPIIRNPAVEVLSEKCKTLAAIAEPPNMKKQFESSLTTALLTTQLEKIEVKTGVPLVQKDRRGQANGVSLTGWMALLGMAALVSLLLFAAYATFRNFTGADRDMTLVLKQQGK